MPDSKAECVSTVAQDLSEVQLNCTWFGAYPTPTLRWEDGPSDRGGEMTDSLSVTLTRDQLSSGQTLSCTGEHPAAAEGKEKLCSFTFSKYVRVK